MTPPLDPAVLPPAGLPGLDPAWSRLVEWTDADGERRTSHVLDRGPGSIGDPDGVADRVLLCVHGNPTWSYLWRRVLAGAPPAWRVVAIDHLDMGWSDRTGTVRGLARRIDDLGRLTDALRVGVDGAPPVVTIAHDWGGPISLGWAARHVDRLAAVVLTNTAVHQPEGSPAPTVIRLARTPALLQTVTVRTPTFVRGTTSVSRPRRPRDVRDAFAAPYATPARRVAVGGFVADIPLDPTHPSWPALVDVADGCARLAHLPALLAWGPADPVFGDLYLRDLLGRFPGADVHRYEGASHLVLEDAPRGVADILAWIARLPPPHQEPDLAPAAPVDPPGSPTAERADLGARLRALAADPATAELTAVAEVTASGDTRLTWRALDARVRHLAAGLAAHGIRPGQRVALLVTPGIDLTTVVYACWRLGAVIVVADAGLGVRGLGRALRGAWPDHVIAIERGLLAARALGISGSRISVGPVRAAVAAVAGTVVSLDALVTLGERRCADPTYVDPPVPDPQDEAAVVFTSGATGPAKGVVYRHGAVEAQRDALLRCYRITDADRLVAAFAPFALYGPALGIASVVPDMDVTKPSTLTARALAQAAAAIDATMVWASPASLRHVVSTTSELTDADRLALGRVRLLMSAGAPVPAELLRDAVAVMPAAEAHTPYGMTEALPVADAELADIETAGTGNGVMVGRPLDGVDVAVAALDEDGRPSGALTRQPDVTGEISVAAPWLRDRYDRLAATTAQASADSGRHRTGDVGHLDDDGRLWVEGRLVHVVHTAAGPITPVGIERAVEQAVPEVVLAAFVGVGPAGAAAPVVVVTRRAPDGNRSGRRARGSIADAATVAAVRAAVLAAPRWPATLGLAAVLEIDAMPVDIRHNSKIDRAAVAAWAEHVLGGRG